MRVGLLVLVLAGLAGCADEPTPQDRVAKLDARIEIICWQYNDCATTPIGGLPLVPIDQGISCMNDALASGTRAVASWIYVDPSGAIVTHYVFTVDHEASVFESVELDAGPVRWTEQDSCTGPFVLAGLAICPAYDEQGFIVSTFPIATTGCP